MDSGILAAICFAFITLVLGFSLGQELGRLQILNQEYTCEQDINDRWQCKENK